MSATTTNEVELPKVHQRTTRMSTRVAKTAGWALFWVVLAVVTGLTMAVFIVPQSQAGSGLTVLTGSMRPALDPGDVVALRGVKAHEVCETVKTGDVVAFMPNTDDPMMVTHRVVRVYDYDGYEDCTVVTKGDANNTEDQPVPARAVKGVVMYSVPKVGHVLNWTQHQGARVMVIGAGLCFLIGAALLVPRQPKKPPNPDYVI
ncbi:MAG: signal peptidase I [Micrococcales bacterium]|nr:signal peptidase I [Micrococcales bacterium]MCL2667557.1 signal peptidase I [Micrococcales bacterium]